MEGSSGGTNYLGGATMKQTTTRTVLSQPDNKHIQFTVTVDFSNASDEQMAQWALGNRIIVGQKQWTKLTAEELRKYVDGKTFDATTIGQKVESPEKAARKAMESIDKMDPTAAQAMYEQLKAKMEKDNK